MLIYHDAFFNLYILCFFVDVNVKMIQLLVFLQYFSCFRPVASFSVHKTGDFISFMAKNVIFVTKKKVLFLSQKVNWKQIYFINILLSTVHKRRELFLQK